jgi:hypothetical protein
MSLAGCKTLLNIGSYTVFAVRPSREAVLEDLLELMVQG